MNFATAFADQSLIYGNDEAEGARLMSSARGQMNISPAGIPVNSQGGSTKTTQRLSTVITGAIWPIIFIRNHNRMAEALTVLNPRWDNKRIYHETRRINIAIYQNLLYSSEFTNLMFGELEKQVYDENVDPSTTVEFQAVLTRFFHYFVQSDMLMVDIEGVRTSMKISDTLMRTNLLQTSFRKIVLGMQAQPMNFGQYSEEVRLRIFNFEE